MNIRIYQINLEKDTQNLLYESYDRFTAIKKTLFRASATAVPCLYHIKSGKDNYEEFVSQEKGGWRSVQVVFIIVRKPNNTSLQILTKNIIIVMLVLKKEKSMKSLNERIKELRMSLHLSQGYVAEVLGINRASFTQIENGNRKVTAEEISKLSDLFGVSADMLLNGSEISQPITAFARSFEKLDERDQAEIMNLIRFKEQMKAQRGN